MSVTIQALKPFVPSGEDYDLAFRFFETLGFHVNWKVDGLAEFQLGEGVFLLQKFHHREMQDNFMLALDVPDLDAWWRQIEASGALDFPGVRAHPPEDKPWGNREVHLIDPAGVCWHFVAG